jgi:putative heme-binding domain-containing protein
LEFLVGQLAGENGALERTAAARTVGDATLTPQQLVRLLPSIAAAGPLELPALVRAFQAAGDPAVGNKLVETLAMSPGLTSLSSSALTKLLAAYPDDVRAAAKPILARLEAGADEQRKRLADLLPHLIDGDAARGRSAFFSAKAACSACHRAGDEGGRIGPDVTKIGGIRSVADLAESILIPSASLARGYESYNVTTRLGLVHAGLLARETATAIYLQSTERTEIRINRDEIDQIAPSAVSIMPQGLDQILSTEELRDIIAFLKSLQ